MALPATRPYTSGPSETDDSDAKTPLNEYYIGLLDRYAEALRRDLLAKRGPFVHRFKVGPLIYPRPVDRHSARINVRAMGLLFQLVLYFRRFTHGIRSVGRLQNGERMPSYGEPYYDIASEFVNAATGKAFGTASQARDRLDKFLAKNPGIGFGQWPRSLAAGKKAQE